MRLLVTGSREWDHAESIAYCIEEACRIAFGLGETLTVVHGNARGADRMARSITRNRRDRGWPVTDEPHSVSSDDWAANRYAGHVRNQKMVDLGADLCIAFWRDNSGGTKDCMTRAEKADIPIVSVLWEDREDVSAIQWPTLTPATGG